MKPFIGVTMSLDKGLRLNQKDDGDYIFGQRDYIRCIVKAGGVPIYLPPDFPLDEVSELCDGLILTGGYYPYSPDSLEITEVDERTTWERQLFDEFSVTKKPILGICAAMQIMNVYQSGRKQNQEDPEFLSKHFKSHDDYGTFHKVKIENPSYILKGLPDEFNVFSFHRFCITQIAPGFTTLAMAEDGIIEGIEKDNFVGLQWHPEKDSTADVIFKNFIKRVKKEF
jgi:putative glutamine amidotransferase